MKLRLSIRDRTIRQWSDNPSLDNPSVNKFVIPTHTQTIASKNFYFFLCEDKKYRKFGEY